MSTFLELFAGKLSRAFFAVSPTLKNYLLREIHPRHFSAFLLMKSEDSVLVYQRSLSFIITTAAVYLIILFIGVLWFERVNFLAVPVLMERQLKLFKVWYQICYITLVVLQKKV